MDTHFARCLQNVECEFCEFKVTDGPITGNFVARNTLILKTKFNAVDGSITVVSSTATGIFSRSVVDITTTTGSVNTNFTLIAVDAGTKERFSSGGAYGITTRSRNAPVRLEVVDAPVDSALKLFSKRMKGPLEFYLHPPDLPRLVLIRSSRRRHPVGYPRIHRESVWTRKKEEPGLGWMEHPAWYQTCLVWSGLVGRSTRASAPVQTKPLFFSSVQLKSIVGRPLVLLHVSDPDIGPHIY